MSCRAAALTGTVALLVAIAIVIVLLVVMFQ
jgi:hypothetical protein